MLQNLVVRFIQNRGDKTYPAGIMIEAGVYQRTCRERSGCGLRRKPTPTSRACSRTRTLRLRLLSWQTSGVRRRLCF
jgi:hypothetical protein